MLKRNILIALLILLIHQVFTIYLRVNLYPIHFLNRNFLLLDLIQKNGSFSYSSLFVIDTLNVLMMIFIGGKVFRGLYSFLPALIYSISPWASYLVASQSNYVFYLFLVLVNIYGLVLIKSDNVKIGSLVAVISFIFAVYSSVFFLIIFPVAYLGLIIIDFVSIKELKSYLGVLTVFILILAYLVYKGSPVFMNILTNEVGIFSDPGLVNTVNSFRGEAVGENLGLLAKFSENKYIFSVEYMLIKFLKHLVPSTFFTSEEKLLGSSFSPPIYLGFLIPFVYGVYRQLTSKKNSILLLISCFLMVPSLLAKVPVDLNRLIIFMPVLVTIISLGFVELFKRSKKRSAMMLLIITFLLLIVQSVVTVTDIKARERARFERYFGQNNEIK